MYVPHVYIPYVQKAELIAAMMKKNGLSIQDRRYHLRTYKTCFVGSECVDWMIKNTTSTTREEAVKVVQQLIDDGVIAHVVDRKEFLDGYYFYRFTVRLELCVNG